jgi:hypothetical protein
VDLRDAWLIASGISCTARKSRGFVLLAAAEQAAEEPATAPEQPATPLLGRLGLSVSRRESLGSGILAWRLGLR